MPHTKYQRMGKKQVITPGKHGKLLLIHVSLLMQTYCFHQSLFFPTFLSPTSSSSSSSCLPRLNFCWLHCAINILCVIWLFWTVRAWVRGGCCHLSAWRARTHIPRVFPATAYVHLFCWCVCVVVSDSALTAVGPVSAWLWSVCLSTFSPSFCYTLFPSLSFSSPSPCPALLSCIYLHCSLLFVLLLTSFRLFAPSPYPSLWAVLKDFSLIETLEQFLIAFCK